MGGTHYFKLRQGGGQIFVTSQHFTTKKRSCLHYHSLQQDIAHQHTRISTVGSCEVLDCWWRRVVRVHRHHMHITKQWTKVCVANRVQQPTAKAHHRNTSASGSRRKYCWTCSREISRVCWYFLARNNTITCKVTDKRQRSNIPGKGLEFHACGYWQT